MTSFIERRLRSGLALTALISLMLVSLGCAARASGAGGGVSINVKGAKLGEVITLLTQQADIQMVQVMTPEETERQVSVHYTDKPVEEALREILQTAGVAYRKTESGGYLIGSSMAPVERDTMPSVEPAVVVPPAVAEPAAPRQKVRTDYIKLQHTCASDIVRTLLDPTPYSEAALTPVIDSIHSPHRRTENSDNGIKIVPSGMATSDPATAEPAPPTEDIHPYASGVINNANRSSSSFNEAGQAYTPYRTGGPNYPGRTGAPTTGVPGTTNSGNTTGGLLPDGIDSGSIKAIDVDNSIIVRGTDDAIAELKNLIHMLDVPPKQVSIKAEFISINTTLVNTFGIDWNLDSLNHPFNTAFSPGGNITLGIATGNLTATLRAELNSGHAKVVNAPIVSTINNMKATIGIGQEIPIFLSNIVSNGNSGVVQGTSVSQRDITTGLTVMPRINGDDSITMYFAPQVMDAGKVYTGPDGQQVPGTNTQFIETNRRVMNGETIVVGGFISRSDSDSSNQIPLLSRLPLIGGLFKTKNVNQDDTELLIFLTPTIIKESGGASVGVSTGPTL